MLLISAFMHIYFISCDKMISNALYIFKAFTHLFFHLMMMNQLLLNSLSYFHLWCTAISFVLLIFIMNHQLLIIISFLHCSLCTRRSIFDKLIIFRGHFQRYFIFHEHVQCILYYWRSCLNYFELNIVKKTDKYIWGH